MITLDEIRLPWREGLTISDLLKERPEAKYIAVVRLNGKLVSRPNFDATLVPDQSEIIPIPMIAGG